MELQVIPKYVDTIIVYNSTKKDEKLIKRAGLSFDDSDECELTMEFYDGIAYEINGTGLIMRYPKMSELTTGKIKAITDYTGINDGTINQHDVALKYGVLELSDKESDKVIHTTLNEQVNRDETLVLLSSDLFEKIYNMSDDFMDYQRVGRIISKLADKFENQWNEMKLEDKDDELDFIFELEKFEEKELDKMQRVFSYEGGKQYSVYVGDGEVNDSLITKKQAEALAAEWKAKGYDDVVVYRYTRKDWEMYE